jgi:uronate dehydrogenase
MKYERILITGAAGKLGRHLRATLKPVSRTVRLTDIVPMAPAGTDEEVVEADLLDESSVVDLMAGVDVVIHLAGIIVEQPFPQILQANIVGSYNVWEAACAAGVKRMVYASSCHAVGMYPRNERLDADSTHRPDSFYGLSKAFGEDLARLYFDKHGIEAACLRIGSCFEEATDERMLATWLSRADLTRLVEACLDAPVLGYAILYGMSDNPKTWWDNSKVDYLGYRPQDSAQQFIEKLAATNEQFDPIDPVKFYQAGQFAADVRRR